MIFSHLLHFLPHEGKDKPPARVNWAGRKSDPDEGELLRLVCLVTLAHRLEDVLYGADLRPAHASVAMS